MICQFFVAAKATFGCGAASAARTSAAPVLRTVARRAAMALGLVLGTALVAGGS